MNFEVNDQVDNPVEDIMDLFPTDHDIEEESTLDEEVEEVEVDDPKTEEVENEESEESVEESDEEVEETETVSLEDLEIKVLGQTKLLKDIPREELQSTVRKGEDYDRVREKLNITQDEVNEWNEVSEMFGMTPSEVRDALKEQHFTKKAESEGRNIDDVRREYESNKKSLNDKMYERFVKKYPDVKTDELPNEVVDSVKSGNDLVKAYDEYTRKVEANNINSEMETYKQKIAELEAKLNVKTQNKKTKKKGVIKKTSGTDADTQNDDFLSGLTGSY